MQFETVKSQDKSLWCERGLKANPKFIEKENCTVYGQPKAELQSFVCLLKVTYSVPGSSSALTPAVSFLSRQCRHLYNGHQAVTDCSFTVGCPRRCALLFVPKSSRTCPVSQKTLGGKRTCTSDCLRQPEQKWLWVPALPFSSPPKDQFHHQEPEKRP